MESNIHLSNLPRPTRSETVLAKIETLSDRRAAQWLLVAWAFWLSIEYLALGPYSYVLLFDFGDSFIPLYMGEGDAGPWSLFGGWDPRLFGGIDVASNGVS